MFFERRCPGCGRTAVGLCPPCRSTLGPPPVPAPVDGVDSLAAWARYDGPARAAVLALKHGGRRDLVPWLASELMAVAPDGVDQVTWVPASVEGRRRRGFDQGALLARALARRLDRPVGPLLQRPRRSRSQRGRSRSERLEVVDLVARGPTAGRVLLVDDVVTTGASLRRAAWALRAAGAAGVSSLVVAVADRDPAAGAPPGPPPPGGIRRAPLRPARSQC